MSTKIKTSTRIRLVAIGALAGIIYNSWLLGYWLNPYVARHDLASELEGLHQPFNWLFVLGDVVASSLVIWLTVSLWRIHVRRKSNWLIIAALASLAVFAVGTIIDAVLPLRCDPSVQHCAPLSHDPLLLAHGIFSILASVGLFVSVVLVWWAHERSNLLMNCLIFGYVLFGAFSILSLITPGQDSWAQHYALLLDGVCLVAIPLVLTVYPQN